MPIIENQQLYDKARAEADKVYLKPSAYKSMYIVKRYKELGGTYSHDDKPKNLERWKKEKWIDIGGQEYPVYRPTKRISKETPLTASEIDPKQAIEQIALKQKIKGNANLPKFEAKGSGLSQEAKAEELLNYSNPDKVVSNARKYFGFNKDIYLSTKQDKKYMVQDDNDKWVHFGAFPGFADFTQHKDKERRKRYIARATKIRGNWKENPYSPNNLALWLLWNWNGK